MKKRLNWWPFFLLFFASRFCTGDWTGDLLQNWTLYTTVLFLLPGYSCLPTGHIGCRHAHLEHFTSPWWLPCTSGYNHQSFITLPSASRQRLCGVAVLRPCKFSQREAAADTDSSENPPHLTSWEPCDWDIPGALCCWTKTAKII